MHTFRLHVPKSLSLPHDVTSRIFMADVFGAPTPCAGDWNGDELRVECELASGYLHLPYLLPSGSERLVRTATLLARPGPYSLSLELARGILHRMSNRYWECDLAGIDMSSRFDQSLTSARSAFARAVTRQSDPTLRGELATKAFEQARALMANMSQWLAEFLMDRHRQSTQRNQTAMIGRLATPTSSVTVTPTTEIAFAKSFDTGAIPTDWKAMQPTPDTIDIGDFDRQLDWCRQRRLRTMAGPLLDFDLHCTPDWLHAYRSDRPTLANSVSAWVQAVVGRADGEVGIWHAATGMTRPQGLGLDLSMRLELTALTVERIRQLDSSAEIVVSLEQPFGEYLSTPDSVDPLAFAATLFEHGVTPTAFGLDLRFDVWPNGTVRQDPVDLFRRLDRWTDFGLPIFVFLSAPSAHWDGSVEGPSPRIRACASRVTHQNPSQESQSRVIQELASLLITHAAVRGICWTEWTDAAPYRFPGCGLISRESEPKSALEAWRSLLPDASSVG